MSPALQTIQFDEFEHLFTEGELFTMQQALESGALVRANQISKTSWNYTLRYEGHLTECEIKYNQKSVKQVLCACGYKGNSKLCKHSQLIVYWHILRIYRRTGIMSSTSEPKSDINLNEIPQEELSFYLKSLIRNNPKAKKGLEFLYKIGQMEEMNIPEMVESTNQYINYLNDLSKNSISQEKNILQLVNELYYSSLRCYSLSNVNRACSQMITGIEVLYRQMEMRQVLNVQKFHLAINKYVDALNQILTAIIAPQSLNLFLRYLLEFTKSKYYYPAKKDVNLFTTIRNRLKHKTIEKELIDTLQVKCLLSLNHTFEFYTWDIYYQIDQNAFLKFLKGPLFSKKAAYINMLTFLGTRKNELDSEFYMDLFKWIFPHLNNDLKNLAISYLLDQDIEWSNSSDKDILLHLYSFSRNKKLLNHYFNGAHDKALLYESAKSYLALNGISIEQHAEIFFDLLFESQQFKKLAEELLHSGDIDQIMYYDPELPAEAKQILIKAYADYFKSFRLHNIGPKATKRLRQISTHLLSHYSNALRGIKNLEEFAL